MKINWRMTEIQSVIGRLQLQKLDKWVEARRANAARFNTAFASLPALRLTVPPAEIYHSYYKYYISYSIICRSPAPRLFVAVYDYKL